MAISENRNKQHLKNWQLLAMFESRPVVTGGSFPKYFRPHPNCAVTRNNCFNHTIKTKILPPWKYMLPQQTLKLDYGPAWKLSFGHHTAIKFTQNCVCFTNPCSKVLVLLSVALESHLKAFELPHLHDSVCYSLFLTFTDLDVWRSIISQSF